MLLRFLVGLAVISCVCSTPFERGIGVVDVPAGVYDGEDSGVAKESTKISEPQIAEEAEAIPLTRTETGDKDDSVEQVQIPQKEVDDTDFFGFRLPTLFVYRRPVIRDPISFPSFPNFNNRAPESDLVSPFPSFQHSFNRVPERDSSFNVLNHMEAMMKRMQTQMQSLWGALLTPNFARPNFNRPPGSLFGLDTDKTGEKSPELINIDKLPANYSNSTSETKEIDGQLVTVNKTIHRHSSNDSSGFFHFQVIKIRPQTTEVPHESAPTTEVTHEVAGSAPASEVKTSPASSASTGEGIVQPSTTVKAETVDPSMNEIEGQPQSNSENLAEADSFPFLLNRYKTGIPRYEVTDDSEITSEPQKENSHSRESLEELTIVPLQRLERKPDQYIDLSDDIRVNKILEEQSRKAPLQMLNDDVELLIL